MHKNILPLRNYVPEYNIDDKFLTNCSFRLSIEYVEDFNISNHSISLKLYFNKEGRMHLDLPPKTW